MSYLSNLVSKKVIQTDSGIDRIYPINVDKNSTELEQIALSIQLFFEDDFILEIYNPFIIVGVEKEYSIKNIFLGKTLTEVLENEKEAILSFNNNQIILKVDLREESFLGPEAMCLQGPDNLIVIWD